MFDDFTLNISFLAGFLVIITLFRYVTLRSDPMLDAIPTIGFSDPILSHFSAVRFLFDGNTMVKRGYEKTRSGLFKIADFRKWVVVLAETDLIDDIKRAPDDALSASVPIDRLVQPQYTLGLPTTVDALSAHLVRSKLTRNIGVLFPEVREEIAMAMDDLIPIHENEWVKVSTLDTCRRVVCRATNRILVGAPLCQDYDYQSMNLSSAVNILKFGFIIGLFPKPLKYIVSRMLSNLPSQIQQQIEFIRPTVEERFAKMEEYGEDWDDKPNDLLMWLMTENQKSQNAEMSSIESLARLLLLINFAAVHSTSSTLAQVLYRLLSHPEYVEPLREEVDAVVSKEGWTKGAIDKMHKIDSFFRETQRCDGIAFLSSNRVALRPFTFSNGVTVPAGTLISIPTSAAHRDERIFTNPDVFDGFRFSKLRESEEDKTMSIYQTVARSNEYMSFGVGRHACAGRIFAANETKTMLAHIVATYDVKLEEGKEVPRDIAFGGARMPRDADVLFRARQR